MSVNRTVSREKFVEYILDCLAFLDDGEFEDSVKGTWRRPVLESSKKLSTLMLNQLHTDRNAGTLLCRQDDIKLKSIQPIFLKLKNQIKKRGVRGFTGLRRKFYSRDEHYTGSLTLENVEKCITECGCLISHTDISALFQNLDRSRSGEIAIEDFMDAVRGEFDEERLRLISSAWQTLGGGEHISLEHMITSYNAKAHPDVRSGKLESDLALKNFLDNFDIELDLSGEVKNI